MTAAVYFQPRRLGHANLWVENLSRSQSFYNAVCGLTVEFWEPDLVASFLGTGNTPHDLGMIETTGGKAALWPQRVATDPGRRRRRGRLGTSRVGARERGRARGRLSQSARRQGPVGNDRRPSSGPQRLSLRSRRKLHGVLLRHCEGLAHDLARRDGAHHERVEPGRFFWERTFFRPTLRREPRDPNRRGCAGTSATGDARGSRDAESRATRRVLHERRRPNGSKAWRGASPTCAGV